MKDKKGKIVVPKDITFPAIIGTGCARSGTAFLAKLLTQGGIPMGHETMFGCPGFGEWREGMVGDVSWLATPFLVREKKRGAVVIQIVRHPLKHISSMNHVRTFEDHNFKANIYTIYKELYIPTLRRYRVLDRYIVNWIKWNQMAEKHADLVYRLEDLIEDPYELFDDLGVDVKGKTIDTKKVNSYNNVKQLKWEDFKDCAYYNDLIQGAHHYKYIADEEADELLALKVDRLKRHSIIE